MKTERWEEFSEEGLRSSGETHSAATTGSPRNTAEAFFVSPLCKGSQLFGDDDFQRAAVKAGEYYAQRHLDMTEPYWGGTLDANCEDKEGAWAAFQAFLALYELTHEQRYLDWAAHAMDVTLSYTVLWDIDLPAGRLRDHGSRPAAGRSSRRRTSTSTCSASCSRRKSGAWATTSDATT